jgi:hypothetical protein
MGRTACTEFQCLYKGALYLLPNTTDSKIACTEPHTDTQGAKGPLVQASVKGKHKTLITNSPKGLFLKYLSSENIHTDPEFDKKFPKIHNFQMRHPRCVQ